jgi:hypothetical protein
VSGPEAGIPRLEWQDRIRRMVDDWPPVTSEAYAQLALLLTPEPYPVALPAAAPSQPVRQAAA